MKIKELKARLGEIADEMEAISKVAETEARELTKEDENQILALETEFDKVKADLDRAEKIEAAKAKIVQARVDEGAPGVQPSVTAKETLPLFARAHRSTVFATAETAYFCGMWLAGLLGNQKGREYCASKGYDFRAAQSVGTDNKGGYTVPAPLAAELIRITESYGILRQKARKVIMSADTWTVPKLSASSTVYYPAEAAAITASDLTFSQVTLTAKKAAMLSLLSTEIAEDSLLNVVDELVKDFAYSFAKAEDENGFNGGNGFTGIAPDANVGDTNVANLGAVALTTLTSVASSLPTYTGIKPEWYFNSAVFNGTIQDLLHAAGGLTPRHVEDGGRMMLLGYPVNLVPAMPSAPASGELVAVFGDLGQGVYFGDRRRVNFTVLNELYRANDQVGVVATERYDISNANPEVMKKITIT